jgi:hypothetical protein
MRQNLFDGGSPYAFFAQIIYKWLISRKWFTYADIMAEYMMLGSAKDLSCKVSRCDDYGELKKAFCGVRNAIKAQLGDNCFEEQGNNRAKRFKYIGPDDDPLADMRNARVVNDLRTYWRFCQDSAGFFPISWLEYFFKDCRDLLDIKARKQRGEQVLSASLDRMLTNIELLPFLYQAIVNKQVLSMEYKPYEEEVRTLTFHPHYLKEFNGRWHLFGHADEQLPEFGYNIALDRIVGRPREKDKTDYISAPVGFYRDFFNNIIGVSHLDDTKVYDIRVRAHTLKVFKLTETKKLHHSQNTIIPFGVHNDGEYGEFSINVEINNEFIGRVLQMGAGLEIVFPPEVRETFKTRVFELAKLYD